MSKTTVMPLPNEIDKEMQRMIRECYDRARKRLTERRDQLDLLAETLLVKETLDSFEIKQLLKTVSLDDPKVDEK